MIVPPFTRDTPLHVEEADTSSSSSALRRMLTPIFFGNSKEEMSYYGKQDTKETPDSSFYEYLATSSYQGKNNLQYSLAAGIFQGLGASSVAAVED